jgi:phosphatidylserine/phosphatidylglycerophosphate/cardiolipin synthase-like enzyme
MPRNKSASLDTLHALIAGRGDLLSRIAAPLWSRVGRLISPAELSWAYALLGEQGPEVLIQALSETEALDSTSGALNARGLARFISSLLDGSAAPLPHESQPPKLVWTLPNSHPSHAVRGQSYLENCIELIGDATETLTLVSPFVDPAGIGTLSSALIGALSRGVDVRLFAHDALNLATPTSRALEELRREASRTKAHFSVYSAETGMGRDRLFNPLFHAKLIVCDDRALLLGSANLTSYALGSNFEAGVILGKAAAKEALFILDGILHAKTVYLVFRTDVSD